MISNKIIAKEFFMELVYLWVENYKNIHKQGFNFSPNLVFDFKYEYVGSELKNDCSLLINNKEELENKAFVVQYLEDAIEKLERSIEVNQVELNKLADNLHQNRQKAIPVLSEKLLNYLIQLGMPNSQFDIQLLPKESYFFNGKDELQFLFSANKGSSFGLLKKVASGGEMSRIMLAVKAVLAQYSKLPTIIFDEIDTGVSGEIANKMAFIMEEMSANMQVFSITHLPQIAARGKQHYKVYKETIANQTQSQIIRLTQEQRVHELAEMIAGKDVSEAAINHAKTLLN